MFILVGLACLSIILWVFFALRRRRRTRLFDRDTATTLAAVGLHRPPLDDDDDPALGAHSRYSPANRSSSAGTRRSYRDDEVFNPYTDYVLPPGSRSNYISGTPIPPVEMTESSHESPSYEPLLSFNVNANEPSNPSTPTASASIYSTASANDRLDPRLNSRVDDSASLVDDVDYSRPMLQVRNKSETDL